MKRRKHDVKGLWTFFAAFFNEYKKTAQKSEKFCCLKKNIFWGLMTANQGKTPCLWSKNIYFRSRQRRLHPGSKIILNVPVPLKCSPWGKPCIRADIRYQSLSLNLFSILYITKYFRCKNKEDIWTFFFIDFMAWFSFAIDTK